LDLAVAKTALYRFALDPVAEFLAAEAVFDGCAGDTAEMGKMVKNSASAPGFQNAFLLTIQARSGRKRSL
jgi:hypothetical protein